MKQFEPMRKGNLAKFRRSLNYQHPLKRTSSFWSLIDLKVGENMEIISHITDEYFSFIGMFLFARLVLEHLKSQVTLDQLRQEIKPDQFPTGLYDMSDDLILYWLY